MLMVVASIRATGVGILPSQNSNVHSKEEPFVNQNHTILISQNGEVESPRPAMEKSPNREVAPSSYRKVAQP